MKRIMIVGPCGAGKSTLARQMSRALHLPVCHIDAIHWKPGWVESTQEETQSKVRLVAQTEEWIIDGNYSSSFEARTAVADTIVFLDLPRYIYLPRVIWRTVKGYGRTRSDLGADCPERFDWEFLVWVWNFGRRSRPKLLTMLESLDRDRPVQLYHLKSRREVDEFERMVLRKT